VKNRSEIALSIVALVAVVWVLTQSSTAYLNQITGLGLPRGWGTRSGLFPTVVGLPLFVLAVLQLIASLRHKEGDAANPEASELSQGDLPADVFKSRMIAIVGAIVGFPIAVWLIGFTFAIPLVTFLYLKVASREGWGISLALSAAAGVMFYLMFVIALGIPVRSGLLLSPFFD